MKPALVGGGVEEGGGVGWVSGRGGQGEGTVCRHQGRGGGVLPLTLFGWVRDCLFDCWWKVSLLVCLRLGRRSCHSGERLTGRA